MQRLRAALLATVLTACSAPAHEAAAPVAPETTEPTEPTAATGAERSGFVLTGAHVWGTGVADVHVRGGRVVAVGAVPEGVRRVDLAGRWLVPAFIDSHVHLAYQPCADGLARAGVAAVIDLGAPLPFLESIADAPIRVLGAGPMVTAVRGYPTRSWGADGYGIECADAASAVAAVEELHRHGARIIKTPVTGPPSLPDDALAALVARAHELGLTVAAHALGRRDVERAAAAGVDILAHTPVEPLDEESAKAWTGRVVVSTLDAFGGRPSTVENLRLLRAAGAVILYGTDLGNTRHVGIQPREIELLTKAGLTPSEIVESGTSVAAGYWGWDDLGHIAPGKAASFLVVDTDPAESAECLTSPLAVYVDGERVDAR